MIMIQYPILGQKAVFFLPGSFLGMIVAV